jgi:hypothetical protein
MATSISPGSFKTPRVEHGYDVESRTIPEAAQQHCVLQRASPLWRLARETRVGPASFAQRDGDCRRLQPRFENHGRIH